MFTNFRKYFFVYIFEKILTILYKNGIIIFVVRECWNWQTGKTKDLVGVCSCGFKSHLPHEWAKAPDEDFVKGEDLL